MSETGKPIDEDPLVAEQERLAALEAAAIGGVAGDENLSPARRPVIEAGGGQAEGFELAEQDLIRHASHSDDNSDSIVLRDAGAPERESDLQTGEFGEADGYRQDRNPGSSG